VEELIEQYSVHLKVERNLSPHTLRNYVSDLRQFHQYLLQKGLCLSRENRVDPGQVDLHGVRAYLGFLSKTCRKSSVGRKIAALRGFFGYLVKEKIIP